MQVSQRIEQAPACKVINLQEDEKSIYTGAGWKLARFNNGKLVGFFDPMFTRYNKNTQAMVEAMTANMTTWLAKSAADEVWLVMCSCYQLCEPKRVALTGEPALALPSVLNCFTEQFIENYGK